MDASYFEPVYLATGRACDFSEAPSGFNAAMMQAASFLPYDPIMCTILRGNEGQSNLVRPATKPFAHRVPPQAHYRLPLGATPFSRKLSGEILR
jgi:hypothetical protein